MYQELSRSTQHDQVQSIQSRQHDERVRQRAQDLIARHRQHEWRYQVGFSGLDISVLPEVFCPAYGEGSHLLAKALTVAPGDRVCDMGTGSGAIGLLAARQGASVVSTDISADAVACARLNAEQLGLSDRMTVYHGDLFDSIDPLEKFSLIAFNLPFMEGEPRSTLELAMYDPHWRTMRGFLQRARDWLRPGGSVLVAFSDCGNVNLLHNECQANAMAIRELDRLTLELEFFVLELRPL